MGISGLLPALRDVAEPKHASSYRGKRAGVDAMGWLHRGCSACAQELAQGVSTTKFVTFCLARVEGLVAAGVIPILVFDGGHIGAKRGTGEGRALMRSEKRREGLALLEAGDAAAAHRCFQKSVSVTPAMAHTLQLALARCEPPVEFIVAPYEADAQLAYMSMNGLIDVVISEDSDMLAFGCEVVFTKLDADVNGLELAQANLGACEKLDLLNWSHGMFLTMCVLAGCDFLPSIRGVGIAFAHRMVSLHRKPEKILKMLRFELKSSVPLDYEDRFWAAIATFQHATVFDPRARTLVPLRPFDDDAPTLADAAVGPDGTRDACLGKMYADIVAIDVAEGRRNPRTLKMWPGAATAGGGGGGGGGGSGGVRRGGAAAAAAATAKRPAAAAAATSSTGGARSLDLPDGKRRRYLPVGGFTSPFVVAAAYEDRRPQID